MRILEPTRMGLNTTAWSAIGILYATYLMLWIPRQSSPQNEEIV